MSRSCSLAGEFPKYLYQAHCYLWITCVLVGAVALPDMSSPFISGYYSIVQPGPPPTQLLCEPGELQPRREISQNFLSGPFLALNLVCAGWCFSLA